jgi:hypothetical protein
MTTLEDVEKKIDFLFKQNVKKENAIWDYYVISETEILIHYHYWTYNGVCPLYNRDSIKVINE